MQITTQKYTTLQISENFQAEKAHIHSRKPSAESRTEMYCGTYCSVVGFPVVERYSDGQSGRNVSYSPLPRGCDD